MCKSLSLPYNQKNSMNEILFFCKIFIFRCLKVLQLWSFDNDSDVLLLVRAWQLKLQILHP